jgi:hypothetical protein
VKEYVVTRAIPIPELLCAFDIYLVGQWELAKYSHLMHLASAKNYKGRSRQPWYTFFKLSFRESESKSPFMLTDFDASDQTAVARAIDSIQYSTGRHQSNHFVAAHDHLNWRWYQ